MTLKQLNAALHSWAEVFMARSMHAWMRYVRGTGLSLIQFNTLMRLHHRGQCALSELGTELDITPAATSQMVDKLVQTGYLTRTEDPNDRRVKVLNLTNKGRALVLDAVSARNAWLVDLSASLGATERAALTHALNTLSTAARDLPDDKTAAR